MYRTSKKSYETIGVVRHIVFVCKGNICRSAFAEYYLKSILPKGKFNIESCGLDVDQGSYSPPEAVHIGKKFGIQLDKHISKGTATCTLQNADLIIPMEYGQYIRLVAMLPGHESKIRLLRDFASWPDRLICNINDPFGLGEDEFLRCFTKITIIIDRLIRQMPPAHI